MFSSRLATQIADPAFGAFLRRAAERVEKQKAIAAQKAEQKRQAHVAELRNPDGPVRRGPATLADILGTGRR